MDANFQNIDLVANEPSEMPVINIEIVLPFPDAMAFIMVLKILPKRICRRRDGSDRFLNIICIGT